VQDASPVCALPKGVITIKNVRREGKRARPRYDPDNDVCAGEPLCYSKGRYKYDTVVPEPYGHRVLLLPSTVYIEMAKTPQDTRNAPDAWW